MNNQQKKALKKLGDAAADAEIAVAKASNDLKEAAGDDDKKAAQELLSEAESKRDEAKRAVEDFKASLETSKTTPPASGRKAARGDVITVVATADRRRAGRNFPRKQPVEIPVDELSGEELEALKADPVLLVTGD